MFLIFAALLIVADQLTKWWASTTFVLNEQGLYVGLGFYFTYVQNTGAAFGILQNGTLALSILSAVVAAFICGYLWLNARKLPPLAVRSTHPDFGGRCGQHDRPLPTRLRGRLYSL